MKLRFLQAAAVVLLAPAGLLAQTPSALDVAAELRWRIERLRVTGMLQIGEEVVRKSELMLAVYESNAYRPLWEGAEAAESLRRAVAGAADDGLDPEHYHSSALSEPDGDDDPSALAELDLLSTDALLRLGHDLRYGRAEPQWPAARPDQGWPAGDVSAAPDLVELMASGHVQEALLDLRPSHFAYGGLVRALRELRWIQLLGGWETIAEGTKMWPDSVDDRVPLLRVRLALEGAVRASLEDTSRVYDRNLEAAVRSFQRRHGLTEDGLVGDATLEALNVPVAERIQQLRINLERMRWAGRTLPDTFVAVSIPGARVQLIRGGVVAFETRAVVGRKDDQTPVFTAEMRYVDLNPTWTVPPGIVGEVLARQRADTSYMRGQGMHLLDASGRDVDPSTVDWSLRSAGPFPYVIRQEPGPLNPLGRVKLMLPNEHHVYLHDTPERELFARERRLFSHGCVRIEDPVGLAELVLGAPVKWNRETLAAAIAEGGTQTLLLTRPLPVFVLYWTAAADPDGTVRFYPDVYGEDEAVLRALDFDPAAHGTPAGDSR